MDSPFASPPSPTHLGMKPCSRVDPQEDAEVSNGHHTASSTANNQDNIYRETDCGGLSNTGGNPSHPGGNPSNTGEISHQSPSNFEGNSGGIPSHPGEIPSYNGGIPSHPGGTPLSSHDAPTYLPDPKKSVDLLGTGGGGAFKPVTTSPFDPSSSNLPQTQETVLPPNVTTATEDPSPAKRCRTDSLHEEGEGGEGEEKVTYKELTSALLAPVRGTNGTEDLEGRSLRRQRKKSSQTGVQVHHLCPVCGITLRPGEMAAHLRLEAERVDKMSRTGKKSGIKGACQQGGKVSARPPFLLTPIGSGRSSDFGKSNKVQPPVASSTGSSSTGGPSGEDGEGREVVGPAERYQSYLRIKAGRQARLCARSRKKKRSSEETMCPVCEKKVSGTPEELNEHVDLCLKRKEEEDMCSVDVEGDEDITYEEYEWCGQTRIRTSTLLPGGLGASGFPTVQKEEDDDDDLDLDVDGDDEASYGQAQYSEKDVILCSADEPEENKERLALRRAYLRTEVQSVDSEPSDRNRWAMNAAKGKSKSKSKGSSQKAENSPEKSQEECQDDDSEEEISKSAHDGIVESLKAKIREQEKMLGQDRPKCLICMEPYHQPVASVQCWHVHCEECWLRTLGAKKVCPQCNMITSATDLRRIFL